MVNSMYGLCLDDKKHTVILSRPLTEELNNLLHPKFNKLPIPCVISVTDLKHLNFLETRGVYKDSVSTHTWINSGILVSESVSLKVDVNPKYLMEEDLKTAKALKQSIKEVQDTLDRLEIQKVREGIALVSKKDILATLNQKYRGKVGWDAS